MGVGTGGVRYDVAAPRATITLDRQETRNALGVEGLAALQQALADAAADLSVRVVVLTHAGGVFSSGADLGAAAGAAVQDQPVRHLPAVLQALQTCPKPVVAAVDGRTRAGGIGLLAACDVVVATTASDFATTEVRLGLVPYVISPAFLARVHGGAARLWLLTGSVFDAARAHRDGLVDVLADDLAAEVDGLVDALARGGPGAVGATKALLAGELTAERLAARYAELADASARTFASPEGREGIAALRERRPAAWTTRPD